MKSTTIIFFLSIIILILFLIIVYQQFAFRNNIQAKLKQISRKLSDILEQDSPEKIMVFTDDPVLQELAAQLNRLLTDRQRLMIDFRETEASSKKNAVQYIARYQDSPDCHSGIFRDPASSQP